MAKRIRVSDDAGANYYTLPGGSGEFSQEAGDLDDTIFGFDYKSAESGLIKWGVSADALYKGFAGYLATIKKPSTGTTFTGEAFTLESTRIYQITNASKQIWDRTGTFVFKDGGVDHTADIEWVDYLFGRIKFKDTYTVSGAVTADGKYFPTVTIGKANGFTITQSMEAIETTDFDTAQANSGYRTFIAGLRTVSADLTGIYNVSNAFIAALQARSEILVEFCPEGLGRSVARGFFKYSGQGQSGDVGALEEEKVSLRLNVPDLSSLAYSLYLPFQWRHSATSTLSTAVKKMLKNWETGALMKVQYLYDGTNGRVGDTVVTEASLSGGVDDMNKFTAQFQGTGSHSAVGTG